MRFTAAIRREDSLHVAQCLEVDVASQGKTVDEALANLREALELYFEDHEPAGIEAPVVRTLEITLPGSR